MPLDLLVKLEAVASPGSARRGEVLFRAGDMCQGVFVVDKGRIALLWTGEKAVRRMGTVEPGEIVGLSAAFDGTHSVTARAAFDTEYRFVPRSELMRLFSSHPALRAELLNRLARERVQVHAFVANNAKHLKLSL